jgi:hypothetical protein
VIGEISQLQNDLLEKVDATVFLRQKCGGKRFDFDHCGQTIKSKI